MTEEEVMDKIDEWHEGNSELELHEFLGWTWEDYGRWAMTGLMPGETFYE